jgi:uncharacterized protein
MIGTILNCVGILLGGAVGLARKNRIRPATEVYVRAILAAFLVFYGLRLSWISFIHGPVLRILAELLVTVLALGIGKLLGRLMRLQQLSNSLGRFAREKMQAPGKDPAQKLSNGFLTCAALFCAAPLAILGPVQDGLTGYFYPLAVKAVMEAFAVMGFVRIFGWGVMLAFLPVLAFQGSITLGVQYLEPFLRTNELVAPIQAVSGLLIFSVSLVMLELKKLHLADYLPSLLVAPLLFELIW